MSKEQYVTFDVAKLLKEKRFDWSTPKLYGKCRVYNGEPIDFDTECELKDEGKGDEITTAYMQYDMWWVKSDSDLGIPCPTQAVACRWLREEKGIHISADIYKDSSEDADGKTVDEWTYWAWNFYWLPSGNIGDEGGYDQFDSYEDAVEAALEYCLTNLI